MDLPAAVDRAVATSPYPSFTTLSDRLAKLWKTDHWSPHLFSSTFYYSMRPEAVAALTDADMPRWLQKLGSFVSIFFSSFLRCFFFSFRRRSNLNLFISTRICCHIKRR